MNSDIIYQLFRGIDTYCNNKYNEQITEELIDIDKDFILIYKKFEQLAKEARRLAGLREHENHRLFVYIVEVDRARFLPTTRVDKLYSRTIYMRSYSKRTDVLRIRCHAGKWVWKIYNAKGEWERIL